MPFIYSTAVTISGHLATPEHALDWLFDIPTEGVDIAGFDYAALVMGSHTYEWILAHESLLEQPQHWQTLYGDKPVFVFSSRDLPVPQGADVRRLRGTVAEHLPSITQAAQGGNVWVQGGGDLAGQFLDAGALDEIVLDVAPVALAAGAPVLPREVRWPQLKLVEARMNGDFARLCWQVER